MEVAEGEKLLSSSKIDDMKTWLSASITDQETCLDALDELNSTHYGNSSIPKDIRTAMENSTQFASNSLAIGTKIVNLLSQVKVPIHRRLLGFERSDSSGFPRWVSAGDRRLLQEINPTPNVTVAADGTGDFRTIKEAVDKVSKKSPKRFVIYIKKGTYKENVILDKHKWNVMMYGDGKAQTIVSGSLNFIDGTPTFSTATVVGSKEEVAFSDAFVSHIMAAVAGKGFMAKDMTFINTAGAAKHQAVAFRSGSDQSDCDITGTIDFIFGNAAVVFQNCNIQPRQPLANQFNTITAQGKKDPNQNTGISIQKLGWKEWVSNVDPPKTIFYAEYLNTGPGATVDQRVKWAGYKPTLTNAEAGKIYSGNIYPRQ
ncbi:hypothetical protein Pint_29452 [Pistacia integerrima]|uniref:Uncharacterized protein n=1 Tax=Pistacia integerrima TaxID=434235 RepID=A0ACC0WYS1_9ROSI|nr:hypothetical protein Pint_29452 [Pistacia integerrima]